MTRTRWLIGLAVAAGALGAVPTAALAEPSAGLTRPAITRPANVPPAPPRGAVRVIANVPSPGDPALPLVFDHNIWEGTYTSASGSSLPSHLFEFASTGRLERNVTIPGQNLSQTNGVQAATRDAAGDIVLLYDTSGRVMLFSPRTGRFRLYATIPNIPTCGADGNREPCSPEAEDLTPEPDYAIWDPQGRLYVTDYQQGVIWRIPAGGGTPQIWLSSAALDGNIFGTAGIALLPDHRTILFDQASNATDLSDPTGMQTGKLYSVTIEPDGDPGPLHLLWTSAAAAAPDGFALARSGDIYLAQIGPTANDVVELSETGRLIATFGTPVSGTNGSSIPFDEPSGVAFLGRELVIANQSYAEGDTAHMALLGLGTGELGAPVYVPKHAGATVRRRG